MSPSPLPGAISLVASVVFIPPSCAVAVLVEWFGGGGMPLAGGAAGAQVGRQGWMDSGQDAGGSLAGGPWCLESGRREEEGPFVLLGPPERLAGLA